MKIKGEETFFGEHIETPKEFIEDLSERVNTVYSTAMDEDDKINQLAYLIGFLTALKGRLNRACENIFNFRKEGLDKSNFLAIIRLGRNDDIYPTLLRTKTTTE